MSCNEPCESSSRSHSSLRTANCLGFDLRIGYNPYSDSRKSQWDAWKSPFNSPQQGINTRYCEQEGKYTEKKFLGHDQILQ
ncbi:hypothetical protein AUK22_03375 [bacterium CG2_30_54_10]|nr:MAG: hypothetical protein AUK22_03375 [bacterium CG2_30_54_10]